jgi:hypothetical protein
MFCCLFRLAQFAIHLGADSALRRNSEGIQASQERDGLSCLRLGGCFGFTRTPAPL